jgi:tRNA (guanine37-N1)-methyltransferase
VQIDILSLFPGYFQGPFDESIIMQARKKGILDIRLTDIREFAENRHRRVDDRPYGGGPGMVMMPQPTVTAIRHVKTPEARVIYLSPQGALLNAAKSRELARESHLILLCGHYEGIDQRALDLEVHEEISIGDYVLTNGCLAAIVVVDSVVRFIPGVLGHASAAEEDSFEKGLLDCPHYTRPEHFEGCEVPAVLLSGHHQEIAKWRQEQALKKTGRIRPDLLNRLPLLP